MDTNQKKMPKGIPKNYPNKGWIKKGERLGKSTEFKKGEHKSKNTEFKKGNKLNKGSVPWNKGLKGAQKAWNKGIKGEEYKSHYKNGFKGIFKNGSQIGINTQFKDDQCGENSGHWKGGITPLIKLIRGCFKSKAWIIEVFKRDNYTCQKCGIIGGRLVAHHIKPFNIIFKENNIKSLIEAFYCNELWDLDNGESLCVKCHKENHNKYGYKGSWR